MAGRPIEPPGRPGGVVKEEEECDAIRQAIGLCRIAAPVPAPRPPVRSSASSLLVASSTRISSLSSVRSSSTISSSRITSSSSSVTPVTRTSVTFVRSTTTAPRSSSSSSVISALPASETGKQEEKGSSSGSIIGVVVAVMVLGTALIAALLVLRSRRRRKAQNKRLSVMTDRLGMTFDGDQSTYDFPPPQRVPLTPNDSYLSTDTGREVAGAQIMRAERAYPVTYTEAALSSGIAYPPPLPVKDATSPVAMRYPPSPTAAPLLMPAHAESAHHSFYLGPPSRDSLVLPPAMPSPVGPPSLEYRPSSLVMPDFRVPAPIVLAAPPPGKRAPLPNPHEGNIHPLAARPVSTASSFNDDAYGGLLDTMMSPELAGPQLAYAAASAPHTARASESSSFGR